MARMLKVFLPILFIVLAIPSVILDFCIQRLVSNGVSEFIVYTLKVVEYSLFGVDVLLFVYSVANGAWRFVRAMKW